MNARSGSSRTVAVVTALIRWVRAALRALPRFGDRGVPGVRTAGTGGGAAGGAGRGTGGAPGAGTGRAPSAVPGAKLGRVQGRPAAGDGTRARHARLVRQPEAVRIGRMNTLRSAH
ncbi:hypothetical protein ACWDR0_02750 [Streptomyces sp. NPDC003691]